ncbi:hypothetical protein AB205_0061160, partial [Aquarana catesbeiana]
MFFRELPEPLFTYNYFNDFVNAVRMNFGVEINVVEIGDKNRMNFQSLAIVFGPTLLKPETETGNIAIHTVNIF